jgi:hypothetical protein
MKKMKSQHRGVSFDVAIDDDEDAAEKRKKLDEEAKKIVQTRRAWMVNTRALVKHHPKDKVLNCTNMHLPSLQQPITERSHGLLFKV